MHSTLGSKGIGIKMLPFLYQNVYHQLDKGIWNDLQLIKINLESKGMGTKGEPI